MWIHGRGQDFVPSFPRLFQPLLQLERVLLRFVVLPLLNLVQVSARVYHGENKAIKLENNLCKLVVDLFDDVLSFFALLLLRVASAVFPNEFTTFVLFHASKPLVDLIKRP